MKKTIIATLVATTISAVSAISAAAASYNSNYSDWFDLDRINATDCDTNLTKDATREEVALLVAHVVDKLGLLPKESVLEFEDDRDFTNSSAYRLVERLSSTGIVCGYEDGTFQPENDITRAEVIAITLRTTDYLGLYTKEYRRTSSAFTDIENHWAEPYILRAYEQGLVNGRGNGRFYPNDQITREEIITILINLMGESNNTLIYSIDKVYDLEFDNEYYYEDDDDDDRYSNRYDDDYDRYDDDRDYEELIERPVVDLSKYGTNEKSDESNSGSSTRPPRPVVDLSDSDTDDDDTSNGSSRPQRPVVDLSDDADDTSNESSRPSRPTVDLSSEDTSTDVGSTTRPSRPVV